MRAVTVLLLTATSLVGCGGGAPPPRTAAKPQSDEQEREAKEHREELRSVPARDRIAYYQLATTAGLLRVRLVPGARANRSTIRSAVGRIEPVAPRDRTLRRARGRLLAALRTGRTGPVLDAITDVDGEVALYARRHPAVAGLVPD
jgi:hypothetical protein